MKLQAGWSNDLRVIGALMSAGVVVGADGEWLWCERCGGETVFLTAMDGEQALCMPCFEAEEASWGGDRVDFSE